MANDRRKEKAEEAGQERAKRELARRRLMDFCGYVSPWYQAAPHLELVAGYLEQVALYIATNGIEGIGRLLIFLPPRHGKSELVSKHFPAWFLGRQPNKRVILTSYGGDLATKNSRAARDLVMGERFRAVFGDRSTKGSDAAVGIDPDSRSVQSWDLVSPYRGGVQAAGVGGAITGMGADLFILDDPLKNRDEAESEAHRERVEDWWTSSAYTRLEDGAAVIGMLTRWHGDDWAGKRLRAQAENPKADQYVVVCMPAIWDVPEMPEGMGYEEFLRMRMLDGVYIPESDPMNRKAGEALWPEKYDAGDLEHIQNNVGSYDWAALYDQQPYLRSGNFFDRKWFSIVDAPPAKADVLVRIRCWDKAGSKGGDYTVGVLMSYTKQGMVYVEHVIRGRWTPGKREMQILKTAKADKARKGTAVLIWHQQDPGSAGRDSAEATNRMLAEAGFKARFETMTGDKETRAGPWSSALEGGQVFLVRGGWNQDFIEEHIAFPNGRYDDQVDDASWGYPKVVKRVRESRIY